MAETNGIIQWISLKLNRESIKTAEEEAKVGGKRIANATVEALAKGDAASQAIAKFVEKLQASFDAKIGKIQDKLVDGLSSEKAAQKAADKTAAAYNERLVEGINKLSPKMKDAVREKLLKSAMFGPVNVMSGVENLGMFGAQDLAKAGNTLRNWFQKLRNDWTKVWNVPAETEISRSLDRELRKNAITRGKLDMVAYTQAVEEAKKAQQAASSTLTPLGKFFKQLGAGKETLQGFHPLLDKQVNLWGKLKSVITPAAMALGIATTAYQAFRFAVGSVRDFAEQDQYLQRLSNTMADFGIRIADVSGEVKELFANNIKLGTTNTQSAEILGTLIQLTGDYKESVRAVPAVLDMMAARVDMTLAMASKSIARAMVGSNESLQRQGIYLEENKDVIDQLNQRFGGEAMAKAMSYGGELKRISAEWHQIKVAMGEALVEGGGGHGMFDTIIGFLQTLQQWIKDNAAAFQALGLTVSVVFVAIGVIINGFMTSIRLAATIVGLFIAGFEMMPDLVKIGFASMVETTLSAFKSVFSFVDRWFKTDMAKNFDDAIKKAKELKKEGQAGVKATSDATPGVLAGLLGIGTPDNSGPLAGEQPLGTGHKIQARVHQKTTKEISDLRKMGLVEDAELSEKAVAKLNEKLQQMKQAVEDTKDDFHEQALWAGHVREIESALGQIEKKRDAETSRRKAESQLNQEIEINGALLLGQRDAERAGALRELNRIEGELLKKQQTQKLSKEQALVIEKHLEQIADFRARRLEQVNKKEDDEIKRLTKMVELNVDRDKALTQLHALELKYQAELDAARKKGDVEAAERAASQLADIERAQHVQFDLVQERVAKLKEELSIAETRKRAAQDLFSLQRSLERKLVDVKTLARDKDEIRQIIADIKQVLGEPINVSKIRQSVAALIELTKHGRTSTQALEDLANMQTKIQDLLDAGNLTDDETKVVSALLERIKTVLHDHPIKAEPFLKDIKETFEQELPQIAEGAAKMMSDRFSLAFTYMLRDVRNIKHALGSMWKGMAASLADELKKVAQLRAKENLAEALTHTAKGIADLFVNPGAASGEFRAAAQFGAAAAAWSALAGMAGSVALTANAAYANSTDFANNRGKSSADGTGGMGPDIYIQIDGVDPHNAAHQRLVGDTMRYYKARYGNNIYINGERAA